jgi:hypothetical protein
MESTMSEEYAAASFDLGLDPLGSTRTKMHIDTDGKLHIENTTDISLIAEQAKAERNESSRTARTGEWVKAFSLPMLVYLDLKNRGILQDKSAMKKWMASEEAAPFRTHWMSS